MVGNLFYILFQSYWRKTFILQMLFRLMEEKTKSNFKKEDKEAEFDKIYFLVFTDSKINVMTNVGTAWYERFRIYWNLSPIKFIHRFGCIL